MFKLAAVELVIEVVDETIPKEVAIGPAKATPAIGTAIKASSPYLLLVDMAVILVGTDELGIDELGTDELGTDELGTDELGTELGEAV